MNESFEKLSELASVADDAMCVRLLPIVTQPTGRTSSGYPYLQRRAFEAFRDTVPHLFAMGQQVLDARDRLVVAIEQVDVRESERENVRRACRVLRQMVRTAAVTAPSDLWLLRHILGVHSELGLAERLLAGEAIDPRFAQARVDGNTVCLDDEQLAIDLHFLLARGVVEQYDESFRIAGHQRVRALLESVGPVPGDEPVPVTLLWKKVFDQETLSNAEVDALTTMGVRAPKPRTDMAQNHWVPTVGEVQTGYRLVPVVLGLRAANLNEGLDEGSVIDVETLSKEYPSCARAALLILRAAGWVEQSWVDQEAVEQEGVEQEGVEQEGVEQEGVEQEVETWKVTTIGARGFSRGPGPFGIIQTYHPYMSQAREILTKGRANVWVRRGENIGASQDANRQTFEQANDALDRFCAETGFAYSVFIEHAIGRGEATRQRYERSKDQEVRYFGADLEDAAIDAAIVEQEKGRLPANMSFVRQADIGKPDRLLQALEASGVDPHGAVMLVGNGFHEARDQTDQTMTEVFKGYHEAGIVLLFTEENALSIDDLRATAFNTYHAGFKYVHEKSGQCLRPASPRPRPRLGPPLRAAWSECASRAGYVRADTYSTRTRTIFPYPRPGGHNPSISVNHFFVPRAIAERLGLVEVPKEDTLKAPNPA